MKNLVALISGLLFALGLGVGGMMNPRNIQDFLAITSDHWNPALMGVMGGAILVYSVVYSLMVRRGRTLSGHLYDAPKKNRIDTKLIVGSMLFGVGWALVGFCPAPVIARVTLLEPSALAFLGAMFVGFAVQAKVFKS